MDLHLSLDETALFVERALETALREAIRSERLQPGAWLPGSRSLAADLGISRGTVVAGRRARLGDVGRGSAGLLVQAAAGLARHPRRPGSRSTTLRTA